MELDRLLDHARIFTRFASKNALSTSDLKGLDSLTYHGIYKSLNQWAAQDYVTMKREELFENREILKFSLTPKGIEFIQSWFFLLLDAMTGLKHQDKWSLSKKESKMILNLIEKPKIEPEKKRERTPKSFIESLPDTREKIKKSIADTLKDHDADQYLTPPVMKSIIEGASADILDVVIEHLQRQNTKK